MLDEMLTQEQIDEHFKSSGTDDESSRIDELLTENEIDIIGEAANIFIATSATTLSMILDERVRITSPVVTASSVTDIYDNMSIPYIALRVGFREGIKGENLLLLKTADASVIADIMMGGDGNDIKLELDEIEVSAVSEAMNQMIGSATTSMASMLNRMIDISPPEVDVWESFDPDAMTEDELQKEFIQVSFEMTIDGVLESSIMQLYSVKAAKDIIEAFTLEVLADTEDDISDANKDVDLESEVEVTETIEEKEEAAIEKLSNLTQSNDLPNRIEMLLDVMLDLTVVFGSTRKTVRELLSFGEGSIIELDKYIDEPLEIFVNNKLIGYGEVVVVDENFGVRITSLVDVEDRIN